MEDRPPSSSSLLLLRHVITGMHWRANCPVQRAEDAEAAERNFPRGQPPARYYVSKTGKTYDTRRKPTTECQRCGKLHWWFSCPRAKEILKIPKGARFTDNPQSRPMNHYSARFKQPSATTDTDGDTDISCSDYEPQLPQKRTREPKPHSHPHQSIPAPPSYPGTSSTGAYPYPFPYQYPFWGSPPYAIPNPPSNSGRPTPITTTQPFERLTSSMSCDAPSYTTTQSYPSQQPSQSSQPPCGAYPYLPFQHQPYYMEQPPPPPPPHQPTQSPTS